MLEDVRDDREVVARVLGRDAEPVERLDPAGARDVAAAGDLGGRRRELEAVELAPERPPAELGEQGAVAAADLDDGVAVAGRRAAHRTTACSALPRAPSARQRPRCSAVAGVLLRVALGVEVRQPGVGAVAGRRSRDLGDDPPGVVRVDEHDRRAVQRARARRPTAAAQRAGSSSGSPRVQTPSATVGTGPAGSSGPPPGAPRRSVTVVRAAGPDLAPQPDARAVVARRRRRTAT